MAVSTKADALLAINTFSLYSTTSVWPSINATALAKGLQDRVNDPDKIDQANSPHCGPAAFVRSYCLDDPVGYANAAIDLYTTGTCTIGTLAITPGATCKAAAVGMGLNPADWLMLGGLRDSENLVLSTAGWFGPSFASMTRPATMAGWLKKAGYTDVQDRAFAVMPNGLPWDVQWLNLVKAGNLRGQGYRVFLLIDHDVLQATTQDDWVSMYPDHWVTLESSVGTTLPYESTKDVSMTVFTWAATRSLAQDPRQPVSQQAFMHKYYGYVSAKSPT